MNEKQQNWPDATLKSSCLKPLKAKLIYEDNKVLDYISDDGALFNAPQSKDELKKTLFNNLQQLEGKQ